MSFKDLGLTDALVKAVEEKGYTTPSPIQEKAIPHILAGLPYLFFNICQKQNTLNTDL